MNGVVIRCRNCGTTQAALGECEACHEAHTQYYCPNHSPGRWLDADACSACGARVGVPPREPVRPPARATPPRPPRAAAPPGRPRRPLPAPDREPEPDIVWSGPVRTPGDREDLDPFGTAGRRPGLPLDAALAPVILKVAGVFGCLRRLVIVAIVLAILAVLAFFGLFGVGGLLYGMESTAAPGVVVASGGTLQPPRHRPNG